MQEVFEQVKTFSSKFGLAVQSPEEASFFLNTRMAMLEEELKEMSESILRKDPEEFIDSCVDIVVVLLVTLNGLGVDTEKAWNEVHSANMRKEKGNKPGRELGQYDMFKPEEWEGPCHEDNWGWTETALRD